MLPAGSQDAVDSFYHLHGEDPAALPCQGLACFAARAQAPAAWRAAQRQDRGLYCHGQCHQPPGAAPVRPHIASLLPHSVLLDNVLAGGIHDFGAYLARGGGVALQQARRMSQAALLQALDDSGLRGRGGAGFPAGRKWRAAAAAGGDRKYLVVNADEGDPGSFSDRYLLEDDPYCLIEGCLIAAQAIGARHGVIYLRKEYPHAARVLQVALQQARDADWLGTDFELTLHIGDGSYLCGEETALLNALEGRRPEARLRPPQITTHGLHGQPTLLHNVETLCAVPWLIRHGAAAYAALGVGRSRGSKLLSLNASFNRPGLYEVPFGLPLHAIVTELGLGLRHGSLRGLMVGGPLAGLVPPALLDTPLDYEALHAIGCAVGHGGVIAFADDTPLLAIMAEVFRFGARESCGKCTPCHYGAAELARQFAAAAAGQAIDGARCRALLDNLAQASLCGHGRGLAEFAHALQRHYPEELRACLA